MSMNETLMVDGCHLHYQTYGPADAPPVLLTHGATLDGESWAAQIPALSRDYRVICWDLRGHGRSLPLRGDLTLARCAEDMRALLDHLGVERAALVGLSLGSYVSQEFGFRYPQRVTALASIGATSLTGLGLSRFMRWGLRHSDRLMRILPFSLLVRSIVRGTAIRPEVQDYVRRRFTHLDKAQLLAIWSAVQTGIRDIPDYREAFPLLIAAGARDDIGAVRSGARAWHEQRPGSTFRLIDGASHCANQDNPEDTNAMLLDFLAQSHPARFDVRIAP